MFEHFAEWWRVYICQRFLSSPKISHNRARGGQMHHGKTTAGINYTVAHCYSAQLPIIMRAWRERIHCLCFLSRLHRILQLRPAHCRSLWNYVPLSHHTQRSVLPSQWHHIPGLLFINVRYLSHGWGHHADRVATTKLPLILDELFPEPVIGSHDRATGPDPAVGL